MRYHWLSVLSIFSTVLLACRATPAPLWGDMRVMHTWNTVPANWEGLGPAPAGTMINLHIALKPHHESALIDALYEVSDPEHPKYGAYLSKEQVADIVAPHQDTLKIVRSWLEHHGVPSSSISTSHGGGWLTITSVPVSQANELLRASYQLYRHTGTNETKAILRTVGYALPAALHAHVQTVAPTTHFPNPRTPLQTRQRSSRGTAMMVNATSRDFKRTLSKRGGHVTPPFLRWLYKTQAYEPIALGQNGIGTLGLANDYPMPADITRFMSDFRVDAEASNFAVVQVNHGGYDPSNPTTGGSVNTQYSQAIAYPAPQIFYSTGGEFQWAPTNTYIPAAGDAYLEWFTYMFNQQDFPHTISISYANPEAEFPRGYANSVCELFAQLGLRGISTLVESGDDGVGEIRDCTDNVGRIKFVPMFPASCPWVTSVGGTTGHNPEIAAALSGGGFSRYFTRPGYQLRTVPNFLQILGTETYSAYFRRGGRGIPDIASQALRFAFFGNGVLREMNGTICATATVAGIVSLLNDYRFSRGKPPLGFLNPRLYKHYPVGLTDITVGSNPGCNTGGFSAIVGWDPVTGLGTLNFEALLQVILIDPRPRT